MRYYCILVKMEACYMLYVSLLFLFRISLLLACNLSDLELSWVHGLCPMMKNSDWVSVLFFGAVESNRSCRKIWLEIQSRFDKKQSYYCLPLCQYVFSDMIGCFEIQRKTSIKKSPQSPDEVDTKFWLYSRQSAKNFLKLPHDNIL